MNVRNATRRPLNVPLPGGKRLFLGPGKTGQLAPRAAEHPPVAALVESGDLEVLDGGKTTVRGSSSGTGTSGGRQGGHNPTGGVRHTGDR